MDEMEVQAGELFVLIRYLMKKNNYFTIIGGPTNYSESGEYCSSTIVANEIIQNFLNRLFRMSVDGNDEIYKITNAVIDDFFSFGTEIGWAYRSVKNSGRYNFCFKSEGIKEILELEGAYLARKNELGQLEILETLNDAKYNGDAKEKYTAHEFEYDFCDIFPYQGRERNDNFVEIFFFDVQDGELKKPKRFFRINSQKKIQCLMGIQNNIKQYLNDYIKDIEIYCLYVTSKAQLDRKLVCTYKVEKNQRDVYAIQNLRNANRLEMSVDRECMIMFEVIVKLKTGDEQKVGGGEIYTITS